jgi:hypothetical protein
MHEGVHETKETRECESLLKMIKDDQKGHHLQQW